MLLAFTTVAALTVGQPGLVPQEDVLILTDGSFPAPPCPRCTVLNVRDATAAPPRRARALILVGHSTHPGYLGLGPEAGQAVLTGTHLDAGKTSRQL